MSQPVEIFFAPAPDNTIECVVLSSVKTTPTPQQIAFAYRLVGARAVMDPVVSAQWQAVVVCTPEFAKANKATPGKARPDGHHLQFIGASA
jgi:hypothetical protein